MSYKDFDFNDEMRKLKKLNIKEKQKLNLLIADYKNPNSKFKKRLVSFIEKKTKNDINNALIEILNNKKKEEKIKRKNVLNYISSKCYSLTLKLMKKIDVKFDYPNENNKPLICRCIEPININSYYLPNNGKILEEIKLPKWKFFRNMYYLDLYDKEILDMICWIVPKDIYIKKFEINEKDFIDYYENKLE